jgi:hypothetical protein
MIRDMGLPWTVAREAKVYNPAVTITAERGTGGVRDILAMLDAEMQDFLVKPVRVQRALPVDDGAKGAAALLKLADGTPLLLAATPGVKEGAEATQRGLVVLLASAMSFEWTDLQSKPLMVALTQELVRQGVGRARGTYADLAGARPELPPRAVELRPIGPGSTMKAAARSCRRAPPPGRPLARRR